MAKGPNGEKRPVDAIGNTVKLGEGSEPIHADRAFGMAGVE